MTEKEIFFKWLATQRSKGLRDISFTRNAGATPASEEEIYAELNRMINAKPLNNPDLFHNSIDSLVDVAPDKEFILPYIIKQPSLKELDIETTENDGR